MKRSGMHIVAAFIGLLIVAGFAAAAPKVKITVLAESPVEMTLQARADAPGCAFAWRLDGAGALRGNLKSATVLYVFPTDDSAQERQAALTVTATDKAGQTASASKTITLPATVTPTSIVQPTQTPQVEETATPLPLLTPSYPKGNYSVYTTIPVLVEQIPQIRAAMKRIGVSLIEQGSSKQPMQAYKVSLGYFVQQQQAVEWGQNYLRPKGIEYKVFNAQGMSSLQLGVFSNQTSADKKIEQLRQAFPDWRLPVRTDLTTIMKPTYRLGASGTTEKVAHSIQIELGRLGIPADLTGN